MKEEEEEEEVMVLHPSSSRFTCSLVSSMTVGREFTPPATRRAKEGDGDDDDDDDDDASTQESSVSAPLPLRSGRVLCTLKISWRMLAREAVRASAMMASPSADFSAASV